MRGPLLLAPLIGLHPDSDLAWQLDLIQEKYKKTGGKSQLQPGCSCLGMGLHLLTSSQGRCGSGLSMGAVC